MIVKMILVLRLNLSLHLTLLTPRFKNSALRCRKANAGQGELVNNYCMYEYLSLEFIKHRAIPFL